MELSFSKNEFGAVNPVSFGFERCESSHSFGPAVRLHWLIHFVESGFGKFEIDGKVYSVGPGEMFVIPPLVETYYEADSENPWEYTWVGFVCDGEPCVKFDHVIRCPQALEVFKDIRYCKDRSNGQKAFLLSRIWELFFLLLEPQEKETDYVEEAIDYIHAEYMNQISVSHLAKHLNLDRSYFTSLFKEKKGISPGKYIFQYRMSIAASLITNNRSITTAANSVGYTDIYNFSRMFKRHFGLSPRAYVKSQETKHP